MDKSRLPHTCAMVLLAAFLAASCGSNSSVQYSYQPPQQREDGLDVGTLDQVGMNTAMLSKAVDRIQKGRYREVHSFLIFKDGLLVLEEYFPGHDYKWDGPNFHGEWVSWGPDKRHNIHSVGKSVTSACVGIAVKEGFIKSVDQSIFDYLPDHRHLNTTGKERITIEHLLTMTSGLAWDELGTSYSDTENDLIALWIDCNDPVTCVLERPPVSEPGTTFVYSSGSSIVLGEIVKNATGMDIEAFSARYLFQPLGIKPVEWDWINDDVIYAGGNQLMTPREMLKFGVVYLNEGVWNGQQVISRQWVDSTAQPYPGPGNSWSNSPWRPVPIDDGTRGQRGYSYAWYTHEFSHGGRKIPSYWGTGFGGQKIIVFPDEDAVVVFTSGNYAMASTNAKILEDFVVPAFEQE